MASSHHWCGWARATQGVCSSRRERRIAAADLSSAWTCAGVAYGCVVRCIQVPVGCPIWASSIKQPPYSFFKEKRRFVHGTHPVTSKIRAWILTFIWPEALLSNHPIFNTLEKLSLDALIGCSMLYSLLIIRWDKSGAQDAEHCPNR